jgi:hypothetical protein
LVLIEHDGDWVEASLTSFVDEHELQQILLDSPNLIPGLVGTAIVKEMTIPGSGKADLVAVNEAGEVWLVECKLKASQEARRAVVGQILAYAGALWKLGFHEFEKQFSAKAEGSLADLVADNAAAEFDVDTFRQDLQRTLEAGRFRLVIAVDQITEELKRIIEFVNETTRSAFSLTVLELGYLHQGNVRLLIPQTYGAEITGLAPSPSPGPPPQRWTLEAVQQAVAELAVPTRELITALMVHAKNARAIFKGGLTPDYPTGGYYYRIGGQTRSLWSLWSAVDGKISINFASVARADKERAIQLLSTLKENAVLASALSEVQPDDLRKFPKLDAAELAAGEAQNILLHGFDSVIDETTTDHMTGP